MILSLYLVLIFLSLVFIFVGIIKPDESAMALVGFLFLFLLSFVVLNGQLQYETGAIVTANYTYTGGAITATGQNIVYSYAYFSDTTSHTMGFYMVVISIVGFVGVLLGLRSPWKKESE
jgi:hypothetical protein